jgi:hypothetical protein
LRRPDSNRIPGESKEELALRFKILKRNLHLLWIAVNYYHDSAITALVETGNGINGAELSFPQFLITGNGEMRE